MSDVVNADLDCRIRSRNQPSSPSPSSSSDAENEEMNCHIRLHCLRASRIRRTTPSPPSSSPDERTNDGTLGLVFQAPRTGGHMTTSATILTAEQIRQNAMADAVDYHDERITELAVVDARTYSRTFMHAAMISHWATLFHEPISTMLTNFRSTPSIAIPAVRNLDPLRFSPPLLVRERSPTNRNSSTLPTTRTGRSSQWNQPPRSPSCHHTITSTQRCSSTSTPSMSTRRHLPSATRPLSATSGRTASPSRPPILSLPCRCRLHSSSKSTRSTLPPPFEQIVNVLVQRDVDAQVARITREEEEEGRTPTPNGPRPGVHPGPGWAKNCEDHGVNYIFLIPTDPPQRYEIAPFVSINWSLTSPELLGTCGLGCPVHAKHLHARADEFPCAALDRRQEFFFADNQTHLDGVDWAMQQEGDDTLHTEVIRHRAARTKVICRAHQVAELHEQLADERFALVESTCRLARANGYRRLRRHITNTLTPTTSTMHARQISRIKAAVDSPWNYTDEKLSDECLWCKQGGHKVENCALIRVCELCCAGGHLEEGCYQPHTRCVPFNACQVPLDHKYCRRQACPSTVVIERS